MVLEYEILSKALTFIKKVELNFLGTNLLFPFFKINIMKNYFLIFFFIYLLRLLNNINCII